MIDVSLRDGPRSWYLEISDNGVGLPEDARDRLTDPYVTTRDKGTGLGLAIVKKIVEQHGGEIMIPKTPHADESGYFAIFIDTEGNKLGLHSLN